MLKCLNVKIISPNINARAEYEMLILRLNKINFFIPNVQSQVYNELTCGRTGHLIKIVKHVFFLKL